MEKDFFDQYKNVAYQKFGKFNDELLSDNNGNHDRKFILLYIGKECHEEDKVFLYRNLSFNN